MGPGIEENQRSKTANSPTREAKTGMDSGLKPFMTVCERLGEMVRACWTKPVMEGRGLDPKTCCSTASKEWPGSGSTNCASSEKQMDGDCGF